MFELIDENMKYRMADLEERDRRDRAESAPIAVRLRQVSPDTGRFLAILAASSPAEGEIIEIGTSAGYSTMWLSLAARMLNKRITTFEMDPSKIRLAQETFSAAGIGDRIDIREGDARVHLGSIRKAGFCFLDADKDVYLDCWKALAGKFIPGGIFVADNVISHREQVAEMVTTATSDPRFDSVTVPIGSGMLVCRKIQA